MRKIGYKVCIVLCLLFLIACSKTMDIDKEKLPNNAEIIEKEYKGFSIYEINYTWEGKQYNNYFDQRYRASFEWMKNFLNTNDKILCWWDYGHMIRGYTGIDVVIYAPSQDILKTVANKKGPGELMDSEMVHDVAQALVTEDHEETLAIMEKYGATHLFITEDEEGKGLAIASVLDKELTDNSILIRGARKGEIPGFLVVYRDEHVMIYKIREG